MEFSPDEKKILEQIGLLSVLEDPRCPFQLKKKEDQWLVQQVILGSGFKNDTAVLEIDFDDANYNRKIQKKSDLLWKALGKPKGILRVLDLTCGLAIDSFHFLQLGADVTALERQPLVYFLLQGAARKLADDKKIHFLFADATAFLKQKDVSEKFDVVYFDPMYPDKKKKSASPRQEMLLFRSLVGQDLDAEEVFQQITTTQVDKVIVKRPLHAEILKSHSPAYLKPVIYQGKMVRYDVYNRK